MFIFMMRVQTEFGKVMSQLDKFTLREKFVKLKIRVYEVLKKIQNEKPGKQE